MDPRIKPSHKRSCFFSPISRTVRGDGEGFGWNEKPANRAGIFFSHSIQKCLFLDTLAITRPPAPLNVGIHYPKRNPPFRNGKKKDGGLMETECGGMG